MSDEAETKFNEPSAIHSLEQQVWQQPISDFECDWESKINQVAAVGVAGVKIRPWKKFVKSLRLKLRRSTFHTITNILHFHLK